MKKIEALLLVHPCLEENLQTVADTFEDFPWAFDQVVVGELAERSLALGYEPPDEASFDKPRVTDFAVEREKTCSARRVADSEAPDSFVLENIPSVGDTAGHILLSHGRIAVSTHLCLRWAPYRDFQDHCG